VLHSEPAASGFGLWAPLSLRNPLDVVFIAVAVPLLWFAVRARPKTWELVSLVLLALATVHVGRNSVWLVLFVAAPAACGMRLRGGAPARGVLLAGAWVVPIVLLVTAISRAPMQTVAGPVLRDRAVQLAGGQPILADSEDAEQLALDGRRVWIANPIDAFARKDQRVYLSWLQGRSEGDTLLRRHDVVLVQADSKPQERLARNDGFREVGRDTVAVLYKRAS
jgi:hypothetical protein